MTEPVAMLKTTQNPAAARAFIDFILSDEGQKLAVAMGYIPAKASVGTPAWLPPGTKIKLMPTDIAKVVQTQQRESEAIRRALRQLAACSIVTHPRARSECMATPRAVRERVEEYRAAMGLRRGRRHPVGAAARAAAARRRRAERRSVSTTALTPHAVELDHVDGDAAQPRHRVRRHAAGRRDRGASSR